MLTPVKLISISLFFFLIGCNENPVGPAGGNLFFPIAQGNKWYYRSYYMSGDTIKFSNPDKEYDITYEIVGEKEFDGKKYLIFERRSYLMYSSAIDTTYYRTEGNNLFWLWRVGTNRYAGGLIAKFELTTGDTFSAYQLDVFQYIGVVIEKSFTSIKFHYYIPGGADEDFELTFQRGVGLVNTYSTDWLMGSILVKAELK